LYLFFDIEKVFGKKLKFNTCLSKTSVLQCAPILPSLSKFLYFEISSMFELPFSFHLEIVESVIEYSLLGLFIY
jgi:hypothetical protein